MNKAVRLFISALAPTLTYVALTVIGAALPVLVNDALAQNYPTKRLTLKVAFPAGGPADAVFRAAAVVLERQLGQGFIIENVPGANGSIAAMAVGKSKPDGYTLLGTGGPDFILAPLTLSSAGYKPEEYRLLGAINIADFVLVTSKQHDFKSTKDIIQFASAPGTKELTLGHWGVGSTGYIVGADFQSRTGAKFLGVPYKGVGPLVADMLGGHIDLAFIPLAGPTLGLIQSGAIKAIAIASLGRNPALPNVPTISESVNIGKFEYSAWPGLFAPLGTPNDVIVLLQDAINQWNRSEENASGVIHDGSRAVEPMTEEQADLCRNIKRYPKVGP